MLENHIGLVLQASSNSVEIFPRVVKYIVESAELGEPIAIVTPYGKHCIVTGKYAKGKDGKLSAVLAARRKSDGAPYSKIVVDDGDNAQAVRLVFIDDRARFEYITLPESLGQKVVWLAGCREFINPPIDVNRIKEQYKLRPDRFKLIEFGKFHIFANIDKDGKLSSAGTSLYYLDGEPSIEEAVAAIHHITAELKTPRAKARWLISMLNN